MLAVGLILLGAGTYASVASIIHSCACPSVSPPPFAAPSRRLSDRPLPLLLLHSQTPSAPSRPRSPASTPASFSPARESCRPACQRSHHSCRLLVSFSSGHAVFLIHDLLVLPLQRERRSATHGIQRARACRPVVHPAKTRDAQQPAGRPDLDRRVVVATRASTRGGVLDGRSPCSRQACCELRPARSCPGCQRASWEGAWAHDRWAAGRPAAASFEPSRRRARFLLAPAKTQPPLSNVDLPLPPLSARYARARVIQPSVHYLLPDQSYPGPCSPLALSRRPTDGRTTRLCRRATARRPRRPRTRLPCLASPRTPPGQARTACSPVTQPAAARRPTSSRRSRPCPLSCVSCLHTAAGPRAQPRARAHLLSPPLREGGSTADPVAFPFSSALPSSVPSRPLPTSRRASRRSPRCRTTCRPPRPSRRQPQRHRCAPSHRRASTCRPCTSTRSSSS